MDLQTKINELNSQLIQKGLLITTEKDINYGRQITVSDGHEQVPVNVYAGKKGITVTLGGSAASPLRKRLQLIIAGGDPREGELPPGLEGVEDFDGEWIGTDESGKGDFFGPLVVAAVQVDAKRAADLIAAGIKDCKVLSDDKVRHFAKEIRQICNGRYCELELIPERYNSLYEQLTREGKNLNHLLAWAHARVLEDVLNMAPCRFAIADKFANESYIASRLMQKGRQITLVQTHKAERNIAVAAASVLARARFLARMEDMGSRYQVILPKGASQAVISAGKQFVKLHGREALKDVCKLHFKTLEQI